MSGFPVRLQSITEEVRYCLPVDLHRTELRNHRRVPESSLLEYANGIKRLLEKCYPGLPEEVRQTMSIDAFLRGLPPGQVRVQTQMQKCPMLAGATNFATHYENAELESGVTRKPLARALGAIDAEPEAEEPLAAITAATPWSPPLVKALKDSAPCRISEEAWAPDDKLEALVERLTKVMDNSKRRATGCYACGQEGNISRHCTNREKRNPETPPEWRLNRRETRPALPYHQGAEHRRRGSWWPWWGPHRPRPGEHDKVVSRHQARGGIPEIHQDDRGAALERRDPR